MFNLRVAKSIVEPMNIVASIDVSSRSRCGIALATAVVKAAAIAVAVPTCSGKPTNTWLCLYNANQGEK